MTITTKENLLKYLKDAIEQETAIVQQENMIAEYNSLCQSRKPVQQKVSMPTPPEKMPYSFLPGVIVLCIALLFGVLYFFVEGNSHMDHANQRIEWLEYCIEEYGDSSVFRKGLAEAKSEKETATFQLTCGWLCIAGSISVFSYGVWKKKQIDQQYANEYSTYRNMCAQTDKRNSEYAFEYQCAMNEWNRSNNEMNNFMRTPLTESRDLLQRYYSNDIIYAKYRTLPALTSIYEYFITGRCEELTGPHGAYNMYEDELRKDTVISQLNKVIENIEQIRQNQYMLYQEVKKIQQNTAVIVSELQQINENTVVIAKLTALNAYYTALSARNTRIAIDYHL